MSEDKLEKIALIFIQCSFVSYYFCTSVARFDSIAWSNHMAVFKILSCPQFSRVASLITDSFIIPFKFFSMTSWMLELFAFPLLYFLKTRRITAVLLILMHLGLQVTALVGWWNIIAISILVSFLAKDQKECFLKIRLITSVSFMFLVFPLAKLPPGISHAQDFINDIKFHFHMPNTQHFRPMHTFDTKDYTKRCITVRNPITKNVLYRSDSDQCEGKSIVLFADNKYNLIRGTFMRYFKSGNLHPYSEFICATFPNNTQIQILFDDGQTDKETGEVYFKYINNIDCINLKVERARY